MCDVGPGVWSRSRLASYKLVAQLRLVRDVFLLHVVVRLLIFMMVLRVTTLALHTGTAISRRSRRSVRGTQLSELAVGSSGQEVKVRESLA